MYEFVLINLSLSTHLLLPFPLISLISLYISPLSLSLSLPSICFDNIPLAFSISFTGIWYTSSTIEQTYSIGITWTRQDRWERRRQTNSNMSIILKWLFKWIMRSQNFDRYDVIGLLFQWNYFWERGKFTDKSEERERERENQKKREIGRERECI